MVEEPSRFGLRNLLFGGALLAYGWFAAARGPEPGFPGSDFASLAFEFGRHALWFVPVGVLIPLFLPRFRGLTTGFFLVLLPSLALGAVLTALIVAAPDAAPWRVFGDFASPRLLALPAPLLGTMAGVLLGAVLARGATTWLVLLPTVTAVAVLLLAGLFVGLLLVTDRVAAAEPVGPPGPLDGGYRDALADFYRAGDPGADAELDAETFAGGFRLALAAAGVEPDLRIRGAPVGEAIEIALAIPVSFPVLGDRFLNVAASAEPSLRDGTFRAGFRSLEIGGLGAPVVFLRPGSRVLSRLLRRSPTVTAILAPFDEIRVEESRIVVRWSESPNTPPGIEARVGSYLTVLVRDAELLRRRPDRTAAVLQRVFALAAVHSVSGDPVVENRAALLALGGAFGHPSLFDVARVPGGSEQARGLGDRLRLTLHGRRDWARHFFLSAGMAQVAPDAVSGGAALLKEQLDAGEGGSGFSFADLMMDAAGARFGHAATETPALARRMQGRLAAGIRGADLAPPDAGLPEGLTAERLESEFGGVGGEGFRRMEAEIARLVEALPLYRLGESRGGGGPGTPSGTLPGIP